MTTAESALELVSLTSIGGSLLVVANSVLALLSLPALASISGSFFVSSNAALTNLSLPALHTVGGVTGAHLPPILRTIWKLKGI